MKATDGQVFLISSQRRHIESATIENLTPTWRDSAPRLALLMRLAVLLNRSRTTVELPTISLEVSDVSMSLTFPHGWLGDNPLSVADLEREQEYLRTAGFDLKFD